MQANRWIAAQKAGLNEVPIIVLDVDDQKTLEIAIIENVQRQNLNIIEEAKDYQRLSRSLDMIMIKFQNSCQKVEAILTYTQIINSAEDVIGLLEEGKLTAGQARHLIGILLPQKLQKI